MPLVRTLQGLNSPSCPPAALRHLGLSLCHRRMAVPFHRLHLGMHRLVERLRDIPCSTACGWRASPASLSKFALA